MKKMTPFPGSVWECTAGQAPPRDTGRSQQASPSRQRRPGRATKWRRLRIVLACWLALSTLAGCESSGDRVLVEKVLYDTGLSQPRRFDVLVFKFPERPVENGTPKNYIKRLLGLPGQILAIFFGQLFFWEPGPGEPPAYDDAKDPAIQKKLWQTEYMHMDDEKSHAWFNLPGKFQIIRKPPEVMMALRRIVYDNDYQAADLKGKLPPRWQPQPGSGWQANNEHRDFAHAGVKGNQIDWLRYQHILRPKDWPVLPPQAVKPDLITDFMGYNSFESRMANRDDIQDRTPSANWCGDLMLECELVVARPEGSFYMELSKGINRFRARWQLASGKCTLLKQGPEEKRAGRWKELASHETAVSAPGTYQLRFANFDARLTVWVNGKLPFGEGLDYDPPEIRSKGEANVSQDQLQARRGPTQNDLEPASIGSLGAAAEVRHLRLWRDTYYTINPTGADARTDLEKINWAEPDTWGPIRRISFRTMYVQPGHYLCLGDNSQASSDSRSWGTVPERLMLGRALLVYYPLSRAGPIR